MCKPGAGQVFVVLALLLKSLVYLSYISLPHCTTYLDPISLVIFHVLISLQLWSFFHCSLAEPGLVPPYWGFHMGDSEYKRKRYCLLCHVFKPERCHHCSICNRCVLNMDHHCRNHLPSLD